LDHSKLHLLPCDPTYTFSRKFSRFKQKFDKIYISNAMVHRLKEYTTLLKPDGEMIIEMAKYVIIIIKNNYIYKFIFYFYFYFYFYFFYFFFFFFFFSALLL